MIITRCPGHSGLSHFQDSLDSVRSFKVDSAPSSMLFILPCPLVFIATLALLQHVFQLYVSVIISISCLFSMSLYRKRARSGGSNKQEDELIAGASNAPLSPRPPKYVTYCLALPCLIGCVFFRTKKKKQSEIFMIHLLWLTNKRTPGKCCASSVDTLFLMTVNRITTLHVPTNLRSAASLTPSPS